MLNFCSNHIAVLLLGVISVTAIVAASVVWAETDRAPAGLIGVAAGAVSALATVAARDNENQK